jgi:hypothetical protein
LAVDQTLQIDRIAQQRSAVERSDRRSAGVTLTFPPIARRRGTAYSAALLSA